MISFPPGKWSNASLRYPSKSAYCRTERLPGLIGLWPRELDDYSYPGTCKIAALLRQALRGERNRGRAGHWAYDLNRHLGLIHALKQERARLKVLERALPHRRLVCKPLRERPGGTLCLALCKTSGDAAISEFS